jgi:hypothetical protein
MHTAGEKPRTRNRGGRLDRRFTLALPHSLHDELRQVAEDERRSVQQIIRFAIEARIRAARTSGGEVRL